MNVRLLTTREIAEFCDVTIHSVNKWINAGKLISYKTPGNHKKVDEEVFFEFLKKYDMPIPEEFLARMKRKKRILVVDDEKTTVHMIKELLGKNSNYEIESACDGFEAGLKYITFNPDLITLDLRMPEMNGFQVCSHIREDRNNESVKIIVISAYLDDFNIKKIFELGADDYLCKPFTGQDLIEKVDELLTKKEEYITG